jgi:hypothetical protein
MMQGQFSGLRVGLMVKNNKTSKNWIITDFVTSFSSIAKQTPDEFKVRLANGMGKYLIVSVSDLRKNYSW